MSLRRLLITLWLVAFVPACARPDADSTRRNMAGVTVRVLAAANKRSAGTGSGILLGRGDYILTNWHVVDVNDDGVADPRIVVIAKLQEKVLVSDARVAWKANPVSRDVAILKLDRSFETSGPALATDINAGDQVWAVGFPGVSDALTGAMDELRHASNEGELKNFVEPTLNEGVVTKVIPSATTYGGAAVLQHQVPINPGNSGGPLFNACGAVVGLNTAGANGAQGTNLAVRVTEAESGLREIGIPFQTVARCSTGEMANAWQIWIAVGLSVTVAAVALVLAVRTKTGQRTKNLVTQVFTRRSRPVPDRRLTPARTAGAVLRGLAGEFKGSTVPVLSDVVRLGRDPEACHLVFADEARSGAVSKRHCEIRFDVASQRFTVVDLNSSNGTFLADGRRLKPLVTTELRAGECFYLADRGSMFQVDIA
jgi:hypothetical protein